MDSSALLAVIKDEPGADRLDGLLEMIGRGDAELVESVIVLGAVSYTHLRAHETVLDLVCRLLLEKKKHTSRQISVH